MLDLRSGLRRHRVGFRRRQPLLERGRPYVDAVWPDRSKGNLGRPGQPQLPNDEDVERSAERVGDRRGHGDAAAREAEDAGRCAGPIGLQMSGKGPAGVDAVDVTHPSLIRPRQSAARLAGMIGAPEPLTPGRFRRLMTGIDHARSGLAVDVVLYAAGAVFAGLTATNASLLPHRAWGRIAVVGYVVATVVAIAQAVAVRRRFAGTAGRALLTAVAFVATAVVPMLVESVQRAGGRLDRAQDEVGVVEAGGVRLWHTGTPYLSRDAIAALPVPHQLDAYLPYQPGMALFGLPKAIAGVAWWTDARVWFAATLVVTVAWAVLLLRRLDGTRSDDPARGHRDAALVRAVQAATVFPICALTIATGGDDLAVLGLGLLALAYAARGRHTAAGAAIGVAGALKLFAWPVALVLIALAAATGPNARTRASGRTGRTGGNGRTVEPLYRRADWPAALRCAVGAVGLPIVVLVPPFVINQGAAVENVIRFPLGRGLVSSPAASPFPGHLIASGLPGGSSIATGLLILAAIAVTVGLVLRPPRDAGAAAAVAAGGLLVAILLIPSTRFGYLLYPVAYACWSPALRAPTPRRAGVTEPAAVVPLS